VTTNIRSLAARTLAPVLTQSASLSHLLDSALDKLPARERPLLQQLCLGTLRQYHQLHVIAQKLLDKPLRKKDADVYALLLLGLFQLQYLRIPDHAAISETVAACRKLKKPWASKLINALLRSFLRQRHELEAALANNEEFRFSHPQWFIDKLKVAWPQQFDAILQANNIQPPLCLRVNSQVNDRENYQKQLQQHGVESAILQYSSVGLKLIESADIRSLPGFTQGAFSVQDEAAQLAGSLLAPMPKQRVLDACAAPGGKSCHLLELQADIAELVCVELEADRMQRVEDNLTRLKLLGKARLKIADASDLDAWWDGKLFDRILLDAPCSATGVIRRHPDIKLLRRPSDLAKLAALQQTLLHTLWQTLAPQGILLYATCSVLPDENEQVVSSFLQQQVDAQALPIDASWGIAQRFGRQLFPQTNGHDGFYYALLQKRSTA